MSVAMRLRHNAAWMALGQGVFALCQWLTLVILARLGGPGAVGQYALALAIVTPITLFSGLQMRQIYVADVVGRAPFADYLAIRQITAAIAVAAVAGLALVGSLQVASAAVLIAFAAAKAIESLSDMLYGVAQRRQRLDLVARSMIIRGAAGLAALGATFFLTRNLWISMLALALAWAAVWLTVDRRMARSEAVGEVRPADLLRLVWLGLPLGGVLMLGALNSNMPRYFIEAHLGTEILGIFAAMAYFTVAGNLIIQAVGQAAVVRLATLHASGDRSGFARLLGKMMLFALGLGVLGILIAWGVGALILELAYGARFAQQPALFVMVMAVALVSYLAAPLGYAMTAMQRFRVQFFLFLAVVLISATGCWLLTPRYGMHGALLGWLGGLLAQLALAAGVTFEALRQPTGQPRMP